jgi:tetratricopeptide (TPR) repeat protein
LTWVASEVDPDEWRTRVRDPALLDDRAVLEQLADLRRPAALRPSTALLLARKLWGAKSTAKALEVLFAAQEQHPTDLGLNLELAARLQLTRPGEAVGFIRAALVGREGRLALHQWLGEALLRAGHPELAMAPFARVLEARPDDPDIHYHLGQALEGAGEFEKAAAAYHAAKQHPSKKVPALIRLAWTCRHLGRPAEAIAALREVVGLRPKHVDALFEFAWLLATCVDPGLQDPTAALAVADTVMGLRPDSLSCSRLVGTARYRAGNYRGAIEALTKADDGSPSSAMYIGYFLAMAHHGVEESALAGKAFHRAETAMRASREWLDRNPLAREELSRFRGQAAELLKIDLPKGPTSKGP